MSAKIWLAPPSPAIAGWLAAAVAGSPWQGSPVAAWCALLRHYANVWREGHAAVALVQAGVVEAGGLLLVREGGWVSFIRQVRFCSIS